MSTEEREVWSGSPSQVTNMGTFILMGLLFWLVVPIFVIVWKYLVTKNIRYELTSQRLRMRTGVFNKKLEEIELYRVKDYRLDQPFFLRLFSLGNVLLESSDMTTPIFSILAVADAEGVREKIRAAVEERKDAKNVREFNVH
jgi:uncharacterized membrane protein YdbT with pleckstrin-like domain